MRNRIYSFAVNRPWILLFFAIVLVFATAYGAKNLVFKGDYKVFFPNDEKPQQSSLNPLQDTDSKATEDRLLVRSIRVNSVSGTPEVVSKVALIGEKL